MRKSILYLFLFVHYFANAQSWRSGLYPDDWEPSSTKIFYSDAFLQDYSYAGYARSEKVLPSATGTLYNVTKAPYNADKTGANDATAAIQKAINAAQTAGGGIVYLPTGTYKVSPGANTYALLINKSNVYLKGDGVGKTFILNTSYKMKNKNIINVDGDGSWINSFYAETLISSDLTTPTKVIPVKDPTLFAVGDMVMLRNYMNNAWINEHKETTWLGYGATLQGLQYCRYITAIDVANKKVTVDVPIRYTLKTRDTATMFKIKYMINDVGLSDFSIGNVQHPGTTGWGEDDFKVSGTSGYDCDGTNVILYNLVVNGWIKNVSTYQPTGNTTKTQYLSNGIVVNNCKNITIDNCHLSHSQYGGNNGNGYAYRVASNEVLISNSSSEFTRHGYVFATMKASGNVIHKCKDIQTGVQCGNTGNMEVGGWGSDHHMHFSHSNLIDNCYSENSTFIAYYRPYGSNPQHRITSAHSAFWNIASAGTMGYCVWTQQARYGYAIGTSGTSATVFTKANEAGSETITNPVDISEGEGKGETLLPQSLYADQLIKRVKGLGVENEEIFNESTIRISPNPVKDKLKISGTTATEKWIIYDIKGVFVMSGFGDEAFIESLPSGAYFIEVDKKRIKFVK